MSDTKEALFVKIPGSLKTRIKVQCAYLKLDQKDLMILAIEHYLNHIENNELKIDGNIEI